MSEMQLDLDSGEPLSVRRFAVEESVSDLFSVLVWARSENAAIDLDALVGAESNADTCASTGVRPVVDGG